MRAFKLLTAIVFIAFVVGGAYFYWTTTPQYSIEQVKVAVKSHDLVKFEKYFDVNSVSAQMVDDFLTQPMQQIAGGSSLANILVTGIVGFFKPNLAAVVKNEIEDFVVSGRFSRANHTLPESSDESSVSGSQVVVTDQASEGKPPGRMTLTNFDKRFGFRKHAFKTIRYCNIDGDVASAELIFHNEIYNADLPLDLQLQKIENHWRIIRLTNFPAFVSEIAHLQTTSPGTAPTTGEK